MSTLVVAPIVVPLLAAAVATAAGRRRSVQRIVGIGTAVAHLAISIALLVQVDRTGTQVAEIGDWPAPFGIDLVADRFSAILLTVASVMFLAVLVYAIGQMHWDETAWYFHPVYLTLMVGVSMSFLTGDLFNLFVAFEVTLVSSYVLLTLRANREEVRATMTYVIINLVASALFLSGVAFIYAATGTVNLADLAGRVDRLSEPVRVGLGGLFLVVFGIKAAIFPLFNWLPDAYPTAAAPVTAIFAGLLTKIGVYAIVRTQTLVFAPEGPSMPLLFIAGATMLIGVLGAVTQGEVKRILSFHIVSQIGYMIMGLGFLTLAGLAATVFYMVHHIVVKTGLFLVSGLVEAESGTGRLNRLGGLLHRRPVVALLFVPLALSLAGLPPFSGFVAKLALVREGLVLDRGTVVAVSLVVSLLTLFSMTKIWAGAFWGESGARVSRPLAPAMLAGTGALLAVSLAVAVGAQPLLELSTRAAEGLIDPTSYVQAVLGNG